ncbi:MAG: hypothetical protein JO271_09125 [Verrucomicrobia bacterium]|nr:hypothetical protein [Verrucomicrobiota bacterium]
MPTLYKLAVTKVSGAAVCFFIAICALPAAAPCIAAEAEWAQISKNESLSIFTRVRPGVPVKEIRAIGTIDAPNWVVRNVVDGIEDYPSFMPYTTKTRILERREHQVISYFRLDPPFIGARDVTIAVSSKEEKRQDGAVIYQLHWEPVNAIGPAPARDITRIKLDEGSWVLEPAENGKKTLATYTILTDGGGGLPPFVINFANRQGVENLFAAVRKQAALPKYSQNRDEQARAP